MKKETLKKTEVAAAAILTAVVFGVCVYQLRYGIDVQDTSSYLTKYRYFFEKGTGGNALYYLLGEFFGSLVFHIFGTLYALNVTGLIVWSVTGLLLYRMLRPYLRTLPLTMAVLGGLAFAVSWVRCVNWNAWSMLFLTLGILCLLYGFDTGKKRMFYGAGFVLGINTFVRFPNLALLAAVSLTVFFYSYGSENWKEHFKTAGKNFGLMVAGGISAGVAGCLFSIVFLGFDKFLADLLWLFGSSGNKESKHNLFSMFDQILIGGMDGIRQWIKYGVLIGIVILLCVLVRRVWKKNVTAFGMTLAAAFALYLGFTREVAYSSCPTLLGVQNLVAYGGIGFGLLGTWLFGKKGRNQDRKFSILCLMEAVSVLALMIGTDTGSIFFRVYLAFPAAITAAVLWKFPLRELRVLAVFIVTITLATGQNCNQNYVYHDGENGEVMESTIDAPVFEGVFTTASRADYVNRLIELLKPYDERELLTIGAFNVGHNVTNMKTFFDSAWADLDYLSLEEFHRVLEEKISRGGAPVIVIATTKINGAYWVPEKIEELEELVNTDLYETLYSDEWYSVYVPTE